VKCKNAVFFDNGIADERHESAQYVNSSSFEVFVEEREMIFLVNRVLLQKMLSIH